MDEIEFRKRLYSDPLAEDLDIRADAEGNPEQQAILEQTQAMEQQMQDIMHSVEVPAGLRAKLMAIPAAESASQNPDEILAKVAERPAANASHFQYFAIAASLILALGVTFSLTYESGPSAAEIAFGDDVIEHLYEEMTEINAINNRTAVNTVGMPMIRDAMAGVGTTLVSNEFMASMPVRFAKPCNLIPAYDSAHLIVQGSKGAVSLFVINNSPVSVEYNIQDERFNGVVIPTESGNIILVGEANEDLGEYKDLFTETVSWAI